MDRRVFARLNAVKKALLELGEEEFTVNDFCECVVFAFFAESNFLFLGKPFTQLLFCSSNETFPSSINSFFNSLELGFLPKCRITSCSEALRLKLIDCCQLDWSKYEPGLLGALYEIGISDRSSNGVFYTSKANIHRCIEPLFVDELISEYEASLEDLPKMLELYRKIAGLVFLDPTCGTGNFLVETLVVLRRLETDIIRLTGKQDFRVVYYEQLFGIEMDPVSAGICDAALFLQNRVCDREQSLKCGTPLEEPLRPKRSSVICGDSLEINWNVITGTRRLNYIIGNPPFVYEKNAEQKAAMQIIFDDHPGCLRLDYAAAFIKKSSFCCADNVKCSLLVTSSVCQGEQAYYLWDEIFKDGVSIDFAYLPFLWKSDVDDYVDPIWAYCVIIGLSAEGRKEKRIYESDGHERKVQNINAYLKDLPNFFITAAAVPYSMPKPMYSDRTTNTGYISEREYRKLIASHEKTPQDYVPYIHARNSLYGKKNYYPMSEEVKAAFPRCDYIVICRHFSWKREYMPVMYFKDTVIVPNEGVYYIPYANLFLFGLLCSTMHNTWLRLSCGRLGENLRYSIQNAYNTFPMPEISNTLREKISAAAGELLDIREQLLKSNNMANLYNEMPMKLKSAHMKLDYYVDKIYSDTELYGEKQRLAILLKQYQYEKKCHGDTK